MIYDHILIVLALRAQHSSLSLIFFTNQFFLIPTVGIEIGHWTKTGYKRSFIPDFFISIDYVTFK